jgi:hypothetical protein
MEVNREIREMANIKNPDNLSTLKENDKNGREEGTLKENADPKTSTKKEVINPATAPKIAKKFSHKFARWSFFMNAKDPIAPIIHKISAARKKNDDVNALNIFIGDSYF